VNEHLPPERISAWVAGERLPWEEQHIRECEECAAQVEQLEAALGGFRASIRAVDAPPRWNASETSRWRPWHWPLRAVAVAAVVVVVTAIPAIRSARERQRAAQARADAQLMEQVDLQISRSAPASLEPALELVSWEAPQGARTE
jgi:hypothetical protein